MIKTDIYSENIFDGWRINKSKFANIAKEIFNFYMSKPEIAQNCCLTGLDYNSVIFDFLYCDGKKTHEINKTYRQKDYPADIITFALFADSDEEEKFAHDLEINLGEIIIALDKIIETAEKKEIPKEVELCFMISHGILHLLGFDHQSEEDYNFIIKYQKDALSNIGIVYDKV